MEKLQYIWELYFFGDTPLHHEHQKHQMLNNNNKR